MRYKIYIRDRDNVLRAYYIPMFFKDGANFKDFYNRLDTLRDFKLMKDGIYRDPIHGDLYAIPESSKFFNFDLVTKVIKQMPRSRQSTNISHRWREASSLFFKYITQPHNNEI